MELLYFNNAKMNTWIIYFFPFAFDIIIGISLFASRHALAEQGMGTRTVGSIVAIYGIGYIAANLFMGKIIRPAYARGQMLVGVAAVIIILIVLANTKQVRLIQIFFCGIPLAGSLFFNAFQSFMLGVDNTIAKPLTRTIAHYTFAWSLGFAIGPFLSSFLKSAISWPASYYAAAITAASIGLVALLFKPSIRQIRESVKPSPPVMQKKASLSVSGWIGVLIGWTGWNMLVTYWPVHAQLLGFKIGIKGLVEFSFAITQALTGLFLARMTPAYYMRKNFAIITIFGIGGALLFSAGIGFFVVGAVLFGIYSGNFLCNMMFHASVDPEKAVKRIAINELCIGISFLCAPVLATLIKMATGNFAASYVCLAVFLLLGAAAQFIAARRTLAALPLS